jgi:hypothetical protein
MMELHTVMKRFSNCLTKLDSYVKMDNEALKNGRFPRLIDQLDSHLHKSSIYFVSWLKLAVKSFGRFPDYVDFQTKSNYILKF